MVRLQIPSTALLASLYFTTSWAARPDSNLFSRQTGTCFANFSRCSNPGLPSNFCCPANSTCIPLAANTTVLCCPEGSSCDIIQSIVCNISLQDALIRPNATLKTTALSAKLPTCRDRCCPHGYSCNTEGTCSKNADQSVPPVGFVISTSSAIASPTPTPTLAPISTGLSTSTSLSSATSQPNTTPTALPQNCPTFPTPAVLIFFFAGFVTGAASILIIICAYGAYKKRQARRQNRKDGRSFEDSIVEISSPRLQDESTVGRNDFLLKQPGTPTTLVERSGTPGRQRTIKRVKSFFSRGGAEGEKGYETREAGRTSVPVIPPLRVNKEIGDSQRRVNPPVTPPQQTYTQYGDIFIGTDDRTATVSSSHSTRNELPEVLRSGFTPSPLLQNQRKDNKGGLGINRGSGLGVGGSAIPEVGGFRHNSPPPSSRNRSGSSNGLGRELLPPPVFKNDDRGSEMTTITALMEKSGAGEAGNRGSSRSGKRGHERNPSGGVGIAGLAPGMPYVYKGSPQGWSKS